MSVEVLNSAIMQLRGKAQEIYGVIKDIHRRPSEEGDADKIMTLSLRLAQIVRSVAAEKAAQAAAEKAVSAAVSPEPEEVSEDEPGTIGHEELMEQSPTYRKSIEKEQIKARAKKKKGKS